jgi:hypothetical protein
MSVDLTKDEDLSISSILNNFLLLYFPDIETNEGIQALSITKKFLKELCSQNPTEGKKIIETQGLKYLVTHFEETSTTIQNKFLFSGIDVKKFFENLFFELKNPDTIITRPEFEELAKNEKRGTKRKRQEDSENVTNGSEKTVPTTKDSKLISSKQVTSDMVGPDTSFASRDEIAKKEEDTGELDFKSIKNDGTIENLRWLLQIKNIFAKQLPKMPRGFFLIFLIFKITSSG